MSKVQGRILVVDDHHLTREMVRTILKGFGYSNVIQAENGYVALQKIREGGLCLVICDWNMPNMSGLEVLQTIRKEGNEQLPFLMLTAEAYRENISAAMKAGVTDYVSKPFTADVLGKKVENILAGE